ncbi:Cleavage and polyadenylation specificity factor [Gracilaria domingensis]|nr:Cleavage and polyadenylation specificity factor [Gracilaria domingensis]
MFGVAREFQAPLGVTHAVRGYFGPTTALSTVFARKSSIELYVVRANAEVARLELVQSTALGANVVSMCVLSLGSAHDLLVLGFDRMRAAVLAWHHDTRGWITAQLIDHATLLGSPLCSPSSIMRSQDPRDQGRPILRGLVGTDSQPLIKADPSGRCLGVLAKSQNVLYIVPVSAEDDAYSLPTRVFNPADVFLVDLPTDYEASNIKDFVFLHGSFEPNVVILYEPKRTWAGRAAIQRNTSQILNISIDIQSKRTSKTWTVDQLPYDSIRLEPIPESAGGGIMLLCTSVIMQLRHGACVAGLSLNCFGDSYATEVKSKFETIKESDTLVECDGAHCRFLDLEETPSDSSSPAVQSVALLSLKGGELYFLNIAVASRNSIVMKRAGSTVIASEIVPINHRFFILASRLSDSLLVEYQRAAQDTEVGAEMSNGDIPLKSITPVVDSKNDTKKRKRRKRSAQDDAEYEMIYGVKPPQDSSDEESEDGPEKDEHALNLDQKDEGTRGVYDDEDELGWVFNSGTDEATAKGSSSSGTWALKVKDTLPCFGPGSDLAIGMSPGDDTGTKLDMVVAGGYAKNGCLAVVHQSVRPTFSANFQVPGCNGVWALRDPASVMRERDALRLRNELRNKGNMEKRLRNAKQIEERNNYIEEAVRVLRSKGKSKQESAVKEDEVKEERRIRMGDDSLNSKQVNEEAPDNARKNVIVNAPHEEDGSMQLRTGARQMENNEGDTGVPVSSKDNRNTTIAEKANASVEFDVNEAGHHEENSLKEEGEGLHDTEGTLKSQSNGQVDEDDRDESALKKRKIEVSETQEEVGTEESVVSGEDLQRIEHEADAKFPLEDEVALEEIIPNDPALHSIILMTTDSNTMVLRCGAELEEVNPDSVGFIGSEKTVAAANVFGSYAIVQVSSRTVRVLRDGNILCEFDMLSINQTIKRAHVCDPLVLVESTSGQICVLAISATEFGNENRENPDVDNIVNEGEFDEYGVGRPARNEEKMSSASRTTASLKDSLPLKKYKDFSISIDYASTDIQSAECPVLAACLYSGSLASEVSRDGVLEQETQSEVHHGQFSGEEKELDNMEVERDEAKDVNDIPEKNEAEIEIDDEDRMLYGGNEDEEDKLLYGTGEEDKSVPQNGDKQQIRTGPKSVGVVRSTGTEGFENEGEQARASEKGTVPMPDKTSNDVSRDFLLLIIKKDGSLVVLARELQYATILECPSFFAAPGFVADVGVLQQSERDQRCPVASEELMIDGCTMADLPCSALLQSLSIPVLIATARNGMPLIYRVFMASKSNVRQSSRSRLAMERIVHRDRTTYLLTRSLKHSRRKGLSEKNFSAKSPPIASFRNIAGRAGMFVGGNVPFFVFAERGYPRVHPLTQTPKEDGSISRDDLELGQSVAAFTEFHNVMCPRGFLCIYNDGETRIGELPPLNLVNYDAPTPMRKIALRCTPHKVAYHSGSATYGVLASMPTLTTREERLARILQSLEKHDKRHYSYIAAQAEAETGNEQANRVPPLFEELHELRVYRPDTWDLIKSHKLAKGEVGLAISNMTVDVYKQRLAKDGEIHSSKKDDDGNESPFAASLKMRPKNVLAVGTGNLNGEDAGSRGRLLLFEISRQEGYTKSGSFTSFQLQLIAEKDLPAPVTAVAAMEGYVIAGVGPQISVYKLVGDELVHLSFAFGQLYCTSIASLKQYVVAADMCKSVSFMYFRDRNNSVNFLGKDYEHVRSYAAEFLIENEHMSIIVSDGSANFQLMNYAHASNPQSRGGKRLLVNGGIHFGSRVNKFVRFRVPDSKKIVESGASFMRAGKHSLLFSTLDGGIGGLIAVNEVEYRNLSKIWSYMVNEAGVQRLVGIHPNEQCEFRAERASTVLLDQRLLDSRAVFDIFAMSVTEMRLIAKKVGVKMDTLLETLMEMDCLLSRF